MFEADEGYGRIEMLTVQDDWIEYETDEVERAQLRSVPARRVAVRGGAACSRRSPMVRTPPTPIPQRAVARSTTAAARPAPLRLTRRGRVVLVVMPALLALSGALLAAGPGVAEAAPHLTPHTVVVGAGESLWTIAERIAPRTDPRTTIAGIERVNGLRSAQVDAGVVLLLPAE